MIILNLIDQNDAYIENQFVFIKVSILIFQKRNDVPRYLHPEHSPHPEGQV